MYPDSSDRAVLLPPLLDRPARSAAARAGAGAWVAACTAAHLLQEALRSADDARNGGAGVLHLVRLGRRDLQLVQRACSRALTNQP